MEIILRRNNFIFLILLVLVNSISINAEKLDFQSNITTGLFGTDQQDISGVVLPWKINLSATKHISAKANIAIQLQSQTGIQEGPYIDGFSSDFEQLNIKHLKYSYSPNLDKKFLFAVGQIKANVLKKGGSVTPVPFSKALRKPYLGSSDVALGWQQPGFIDNSCFSFGYALNNISTTTSPEEDRKHSVFLESYYTINNTNIWSQFSRDDLSPSYEAKDFFSFGVDHKFNTITLNTAIYLDHQDGLLGFDIGYLIPLCVKYPGKFGVGFALNKDKHATTELSYIFNPYSSLEVTVDYYFQKPRNGDNGYGSGGIKVKQSII